MELYTNQLQQTQFNIPRHGKGKKHIIKCLDIFTFDLENTNAWVTDNGDVIPYETGKDNDYWLSLTPTSLVYIWQFSINDKVYYGRNLEDFLKVLDDMPKDAKCQIFVHNLSHEFCFLRNILTVKNVFARSPHSPMKCSFEEYPNIEFRCSYTMTNLSLENWGKQIGFYKKSGQLDYDLLRTPLSKLEPDELEYAEYDCLVVYHGILKELETYATVFDIPLTSTGKVRKICKELLFQDSKYQNYIKSLVPQYEEYKILQQCFAGGVTHCNRLHSDTVIDSKDIGCVIGHFDFCSSYPTVLLTEKYPCSPFQRRTEKWIPKPSDKYAFIYHLRFTNIYNTNFNSYLQISKCITTGHVVRDNGRIISCDGTLEITCTDIDYEIIKMLYDWDRIELLDSYYARKDYLPREFLNYILTLYSDKTTLKGVDGMEDFYMLQKGRLNSLYGMSVTALISPECTLIGDDWVSSCLTREMVEKKLNDLRSKKYKHGDTRYFLNYATGVWCTAFARFNLFRCICCPGTRNGRDVYYYDTDSIFCKGKPDYTWYNNEVDEKLKKVCEVRKLDYTKTRPLDKKGIAHPLGWFESEDDILQFKCIHAKCYCERREDNMLHMTISGINKSAVELLNDDIKNFECGFAFNPDASCVHKLLTTYCNNQPVVTYPDGYKSTYQYGKNMRRTGYVIDNTDEYKELLDFMQLNFDELQQWSYVKMKGTI